MATEPKTTDDLAIYSAGGGVVLLSAAVMMATDGVSGDGLAVLLCGTLGLALLTPGARLALRAARSRPQTRPRTAVQTVWQPDGSAILSRLSARYGPVATPVFIDDLPHRRAALSRPVGMDELADTDWIAAHFSDLGVALLQPDLSSGILLSWRYIRNAEFRSDSSTSLSRVAVGGLLAGPLGAGVGAIAKKTTSSLVIHVGDDRLVLALHSLAASVASSELSAYRPRT
jgi:hypothetical protein